MKQNIYYNNRLYINCEITYPGRLDVMRDTGNEYRQQFGDFELHLRSLTSYPYTGTNLKDGQVVVEGVDYKLMAQGFAGFDKGEWVDLIDAEIWYIQNEPENKKKRIIAIPKENIEVKETQEDMWREIEKTYLGTAKPHDATAYNKSKFTITRN